MAIDGNFYSSKEVQVGIAQESTFGTATADAGTFVQLVDFDSITWDYGSTKQRPLTNRAYRMKYSGDVEAASLAAAESGGVRTITISGIRFRRTDLAEFLYAVFQNVTEDAVAATFSKDFAAATTSPDYTSDEGYFCTIGIKLPIAAYDIKFTSCICTSLTLRADLVGGDGCLMGDATFISGFAASTTATFSGTWTAVAATYWDMNALQFKQWAGNDLVVYSFDITIANNGRRVGTGAAGICESYSVTIPELMITGNMTAKYDTDTQGMQAAIGQSSILEWANAADTLADAAGEIAFDMNQIILLSAQPGGADDLTISFSWEAVINDTGPVTPEIRVADGLDQTW